MNHDLRLSLSCCPLFPFIINVRSASHSEAFLCPILLPPPVTYSHPLHQELLIPSHGLLPKGSNGKTYVTFFNVITTLRSRWYIPILQLRRSSIGEVYRRAINKIHVCLTDEKKFSRQHFLFKLSVDRRVLLVFS